MPARLSRVRRALLALGIQVITPTRGSHWKAERDGKAFPLPAHNAEKTELDDRYIKALCRCFGLDEKAFREQL